MDGELLYFNQDWTVKTSTPATSLLRCIVRSLYRVISASSLLQCAENIIIRTSVKTQNTQDC
jgi:hypothetical protein